MRGERVTLTLDSFEQRLMVNGLVEFKNILQKQDKPLEDVEDLILKVINAATVKEKQWKQEVFR